MGIDQLRGNSHAERRKDKKERQMPDALNMRGKVKTKEKSTWKKVIDNLFKEDLDTIGDHVKDDVIKPAICELVFEAFTDGLEMALFGSDGRRRKKRSDGRTAYGSFYSSAKAAATRREKSEPRLTGYDLIELEFDDKQDAEDILDCLCDEIQEYGDVTGAVLKRLLGKDSTITHVDKTYGWTDMSKASIDRIRGGTWILSLPKAEALE